MEPTFAKGIQPLLYLRKPLYFITVTTITKSDDGAMLIGRQDQKDVAHIPVAAICEVTDSARQMQIECESISVVFSKRSLAPQ
jgi:hypothetical protein